MVRKKRSAVISDPPRRPSALPAPAEPNGTPGSPVGQPSREPRAFTDIDAQEKLVLGLFTTRPGLSTLRLYYELSCGRVNLLRYKKWQQSKPQRVSDAAYKRMVKRWTSSTEHVGLLMDHFLRNDNWALDYASFYSPAHKLSVAFLLDPETEVLVIDDEYNLLLDFALQCRALVEQLLNQIDLPSLLAKCAYGHGRLFQLCGRYVWYTFSAEQFDEAQDICYKYLSVLTDKLTAQQDLIPQIQPLFEIISSSKASHWVYGDGLFTENPESDSNSDSDHWPQKRLSAQERVYSFDLKDDGTLEASNVFNRTRRRHQALYQVLNLQKQNTAPLLSSQFFTLCALVDPVTQPTPNDSHIVSIDLLSDMFLGLLYSEINELHIDWRFHVCFNLQKIVQATLPRLNCHDFQRLNSVNNSDDSIDWRRNLHKWLPQGLNTQDLELIYMIDILAIYIIHKLYRDLPAQMNPFLASMISLWKNLTFVVLLGLEIDRFEEEQETFSTPVLVRAAIRGSSALRSVVATILNGHVEYKRHDFQHEPINIFMSPHGRKLCHGALYTDVRSHAAAMLALGIELEDVTNLLSDLQPGDRFDEDVKYMFDYEYDNYNEVDTEELDEDELEDVESRERIKEMRAYYKRCHCQFDDDELLPEDEEDGRPDASPYRVTRDAPPDNNVKLSNTSKPMALRSQKDSVEFDFNGRDWRGIPRGLNFYFNENYEFEKHLSSGQAHSLMCNAAEKKLPLEEGTQLLRVIATCVAKEQELTVLRSALLLGETPESENHSTLVADGDLTTDFVYEKWCENSMFEKILFHNETLVWRMMDEMLMCSGYRRVLIWFITHLEVSNSMIEYIYTLVLGNRGEKAASDGDYAKVPFSRQGAIVLSDIEIKMLLQEFFTNAAIFFSKQLRESLGDGEDDEDQGDDEKGSGISPHVVGLMKLVCYMVKSLMQKEMFDFKDPDYIFELQTLLMSWICILPEARDLFFALRSLVDEQSQNIKLESESIASACEPDSQSEPQLPQGTHAELEPEATHAVSIYNKKLMSLLPPAAGTENSAITALRSFISKHSLTTKTALFGRRVISQDDTIMPMYMSDREMDNRQFLAEFGIDYNDFVDGAYDSDFVYD
ncbi:CCR4-NOT core subunit CAF130 [Lachancea thermotolerans CBS 6340]|uniref:KLTH0G02442p n=1 Tax=Lachancea thermotolerans (strain ATCC 56472 / CBS 6340 / NRRL Y-8284) TaxID=559295 RepID=C5DLP7_LACTC|nr:KLTH0G02442p [Lachancea thermotolerans CBS 6340]CAR24708.1 KLTH0G02442p [Lachancea thermotolerans CBS 6340]